jgi:hypothetical protein
MGLNLGSIFNSIKLPKLDFGSAIDGLSKGDFSKITDTLKSVVSDAFQPSKDGANIFQSDISILGVKLPNPMNILAERLLAGVGNKLSSSGFDDNTIANLLTSKLPSLVDRGSTSQNLLDKVSTDVQDQGQADTLRSNLNRRDQLFSLISTLQGNNETVARMRKHY